MIFENIFPCYLQVEIGLGCPTYDNWKCNFPTTQSVRPSVGQLVGWVGRSVSHGFLTGQEVSYNSMLLSEHLFKLEL